MFGHSIDSLILFTTANIIIYFDRGLIAGCLTAIQHDIGHLTDAQAGVLGSGFILGYMLACPLFAYYSKQFNSYKLMAVGLFLWAMAVLLCGLTNNYITLIGGRILTGVGEASFAGLAPAAIDDLAPKHRRTFWLSVFYSGIPIGGSMGYIVGGSYATISLKDIIHQSYTWHIGFIIEGLIMLPLVAAVFIWPTVDTIHIDNSINSNNPAAASIIEPLSPPSPELLRSVSQPQLQSYFSRSYSNLANIQQPQPQHQHQSIIRAASTTNLHNKSFQFDRTVSAASTSGSKSVGLSPVPEYKRTRSMIVPKSYQSISNNNSNNPYRTSLEQQLQLNHDTDTDNNNNQSLTIDFNQSNRPSALLRPSPINIPNNNNNIDSNNSIITAVEQPFFSDVVLLLTDGVYILLVLGYASLAFVIGALGFWGPSMFSQLLHISITESTQAIGIITFICGISGTAGGGLLLDYRCRNKSIKIQTVKISLELCVLLTSLSIIFSLSSVLIDSVYISLTCLALADLFLFATGPPINAALLSLAPIHLRSLAMALSILIMHLLGDLPSPVLMGLITDIVKDIRLTLIILSLWLCWTILFWSIAVYYSNRRINQLKLQLLILANNNNTAVNTVEPTEITALLAEQQQLINNEREQQQQQLYNKSKSIDSDLPIVVSLSNPNNLVKTSSSNSINQYGSLIVQ